MAKNTIPMYHPVTGGRTEALTEGQAAAFKLAGWKQGFPPKRRVVNKESK